MKLRVTQHRKAIQVQKWRKNNLLTWWIIWSWEDIKIPATHDHVCITAGLALLSNIAVVIYLFCENVMMCLIYTTLDLLPNMMKMHNAAKFLN